MLIVVSPAKALDFESKPATRKYSEPLMLDRLAELASIMATKTPDDLSAMMSISPSLAELNFERFQDWEPPFTPANARPAVLAFNGDTYIGLDAPGSFTERDYTHAQKVLRILSGLHGVLRPLDLIQPYRLEMGSRVEHPGGHDLYSFWGDRVTDALNADLDASPGARVLVNLASNEYFGVVQSDRVDGRVITPEVPRRQGRRRLQDRELLRQTLPRHDGRLDHPRTDQVSQGSGRLRRSRLSVRPGSIDVRRTGLRASHRLTQRTNSAGSATPTPTELVIATRGSRLGSPIEPSESRNELSATLRSSSLNSASMIRTTDGVRSPNSVTISWASCSFGARSSTGVVPLCQRDTGSFFFAMVTLSQWFGLG